MFQSVCCPIGVKRACLHENYNPEQHFKHFKFQCFNVCCPTGVKRAWLHDNYNPGQQLAEKGARHTEAMSAAFSCHRLT